MPNALDNTNEFGECDEDMVNYTGILELFEVPKVFEISTENNAMEGLTESEDKTAKYNLDGITVNDNKNSKRKVVKRRKRKKTVFTKKCKNTKNTSKLDSSTESVDKNGSCNIDDVTVNGDQTKNSKPKVLKRRKKKKKVFTKKCKNTDKLEETTSPPSSPSRITRQDTRLHTKTSLPLNGHIEPVDNDIDIQEHHKRGNFGWEDCLRERPARAYPFQSTVLVSKKRKRDNDNSMPLKKGKKKNSSHLKNTQTTEHTAKPSIQTRNVGEIVWTRWRQTGWWPAVVVCDSDIGQQPLPPGQAYVFWPGDNVYSSVPTSSDKMVDFVSNFNDKFPKVKEREQRFAKCVLETIHTCALVAKHDISHYSDEETLEWARNGFSTESSKEFPFSPDPDDPIPQNIKARLEAIKALYGTQEEGVTTEDVTIISNKNISIATTDPFREDVLLKVKKGQLELNDMCIACGKIGAAVVKTHPLCYGGLCEECETEVRNTMYAVGRDDRGAFCCICAKPGVLVICDNKECTRVICSICIETLAGPGKMTEVEKANPWHCYLCTAYNENTHGLIHAHENYKENVVNFFCQKEYNRVIPPGYFKSKKKIRVLSLFDGISAGRFCIDRLGLEVEVYYASEICQDSMTVSAINFPGKIVQLGPVEGIDDAKIMEIGPIDLVIGGSPCEELSRANPNRKGLFDGTGELFFDFYRVLTSVRFANRDLAEMKPDNEERYVFFLYENVASMPNKFRETISRFLECQPAVLNHDDFTAQKRQRYFWGNIPGMYSGLSVKILNKQMITLESVLMPGCNRKALMDFVRTITTRSNSLIQSKDDPYPVIMNGIHDVMWTTEIEMQGLFGFPKHYTDTGNLAPTKRKALVARSWCIPVVVHLMQSLKTFFRVIANVPTSTTAS